MLKYLICAIFFCCILSLNSQANDKGDSTQKTIAKPLENSECEKLANAVFQDDKKYITRPKISREHYSTPVYYPSFDPPRTQEYYLEGIACKFEFTMKDYKLWPIVRPDNLIYKSLGKAGLDVGSNSSMHEIFSADSCTGGSVGFAGSKAVCIIEERFQCQHCKDCFDCEGDNDPCPGDKEELKYQIYCFQRPAAFDYPTSAN